MTSPSDSGTDLSADLEAAIAIHRTGRIDEAESTYRRVLAEQPDHAEALHMLGVVHLQKGRLNEALTQFQEAIARNGDDARYYNNLGSALMGLGRRDEAIAAFQQALDRDPDFLTARNNRGTALIESLRHSEAAREFAAVLDKDPGNRAALNNFGALLMKQNQAAEARAYFHKCVQQHPDNVGLLFNLGAALERLNKLDEAEAVVRQALDISPEANEPRFLLARLDHRAGRLDQARTSLKSLIVQPLGEDMAIDAWFELGRVLDRTGESDEAFAAFREGNRLEAGTAEAENAQGGRLLARVKANRYAITRDRLLSPAQGTGDPVRPPPVFFVGFPRSGTTLMENMLASHPEVITTEESSPLAPPAAELRTAEAYAAALDRTDEDGLERERGAFWSRAEKRHGPIQRQQLIDKMPLNIVELGYANLLFPDGRAVIALRDPRDVCLSCFMQRFKMTDSMSNFVDFGETVRAYAAVMELWLHHREILTIPWLEYRYEDLVEDVEGTVKGVLEFIGLDWHPDVAAYRERAKQKAIKTPSYRDVTSQVYGRAVGRWRGYRKAFEPHLDTLQPFVSAFGYQAD